MRRRLEPARNTDEGFSLIEMLVSMLVFSIAIGMIYSVVVLVQTKTSKVDSSADAVSQLRLGLAQIDRQVRSGNVLYAPGNEAPPGVDSTTGCTSPAGDPNSGNCMRIFTQVDGTPHCVQWQLLPDSARPGTTQLRSRTWLPKWQTLPPGSVSAWKIDARGLATESSKRAFTLVGGTTYGARLLAVRLEALDPRRGAPVVITSSLSGRNTNYGYDAGQCTPVPPA